MIWIILTLAAIAIVLVVILRKLPLFTMGEAIRVRLSKKKVQEGEGEKDFFGGVENEYVVKGDRLFSQKKFKSAEKWYLEAIKLEPRNAKIYGKLGIIYLEEKNYPDARDAFEQAVKLDPGVASRHYNLAIATRFLGDYKKAISSLRRAQALDPENPKYQRLLEEIKKILG